MNIKQGLFRIWVVLSCLICVGTAFVTNNLVQSHYENISYQLGQPYSKNHENIRKVYYSNLDKEQFEEQIISRFPKIDMNKKFPWLQMKKGPSEYLPSYYSVITNEGLHAFLLIGFILVPLASLLSGWLLLNVSSWVINGFKRA